MGLHGGMWRVHSSAVDDTEIILEALRWLCGDEAEVRIFNDKSSIGAKMCFFECKMKSKQAKESLKRIEPESIKKIIRDDLESRIDGGKNFHIRLDLTKLVSGKGILCEYSQPSVVKGKFKLEVYPGQEETEVAKELLSSVLN
tara:strand:+ start:340 stop:768 length:429 start_codon:yes stop_codon:yes gene_type:complete